MQWQLHLLLSVVEALVAIGIGAAIGHNLAGRKFAKLEAAREEANRLKVQREMHDAKRTHLPREGVTPTTIHKGAFRGRQE